MGTGEAEGQSLPKQRAAREGPCAGGGMQWGGRRRCLSGSKMRECVSGVCGHGVCVNEEDRPNTGVEEFQRIDPTPEWKRDRKSVV